MFLDVTLLLYAAFAGVVLAAFAAGWFFSKEQTIKRGIRKLRATPIGNISAPGLVKVRGTVRTLDTITAPLSGRPCAFYEVIVEERVSSGKSHHWRTVIREVEERDFLVEDGTGRARIEMVAVQAAVTKDGHWSSGTFDDATPQLEEFLQRHGQKSEGWLFNRTLRYREGVIESGEEVAVVGNAELEQDPEPSSSGAGYRDAPMRRVIRAHEPAGLLVSDDPTTLG